VGEAAVPDNTSLGGLFDNISTSALLASVLWGGIGSGFLVYGWKQKAAIPLAVGLALSGVTFFMWNSALWMSVVSVAILAGFIWAKKQGY
jgi:hypothetical protein